jgi:metal-responsive CopG/Arc/MetJ family transcriptional regulator
MTPKLEEDKYRLDTVVDRQLLDRFDKAWQRRNFSTRSEAVRALVRGFTEESEHELSRPSFGIRSFEEQRWR